MNTAASASETLVFDMPQQERDMFGFGVENIPQRAHAYGEKYCLAIGINDYRHWKPLGNASNDANKISSILESDFGFQTKLVTDSDATKPQIAEEIQDSLREKAKENDLVVVFFAGHGATHRTPSGQQRGSIVPVEARLDRRSDLISMSELARWTEHLYSRHVLYVFDSCFSGLAVNRAGHAAFTRDMLSRKARIVITSGGADQTVSDGGWGDNSVFTGLFLRGLDGDGASSEGIVSARSIYLYLSQSVPQHFPQTPAMGQLPGDEGGDVILSAPQPISLTDSAYEPPTPPPVARPSIDIRPQEDAQRNEAAHRIASQPADTSIALGSELSALVRSVRTGGILLLMGCATVIVLFFRSESYPWPERFLFFDGAINTAVLVGSLVLGWIAWSFLRQGRQVMRRLEFNRGLDPETIRATLVGSSPFSVRVIPVRVAAFMAALALSSLVLLWFYSRAVSTGADSWPSELFLLPFTVVVSWPFLEISLANWTRYFNPNGWSSRSLTWLSEKVLPRYAADVDLYRPINEEEGIEGLEAVEPGLLALTREEFYLSMISAAEKTFHAALRRWGFLRTMTLGSTRFATIKDGRRLRRRKKMWSQVTEMFALTLTREWAMRLDGVPLPEKQAERIELARSMGENLAYWLFESYEW